MARFEHEPARKSPRLDLVEANLYEGAGYLPVKWESVSSDATIGEVPAGRYYIGDLVHGIKDSVFNEIIDKTYEYKNGIYTSSKGSWFAFRCLGRTGQFKSSSEYRYIVNSGIVGIMSEDLLEKTKTKNTQEYMTLHEFTEPVKLIFDKSALRFTSGADRLNIVLY